MASADFANGFISDLMPLLSLFGEQVTKQFMSHTMYWSDHIIFAMAPLGIIAAVVGTTRVAGPTWMKAVIGRARESKGLAEVELMSSTSHDVCELWNGRQIVRVTGAAPMKQLLYFPHHIGRPVEHCGWYTLEDAAARGLLVPKKDCSRFDFVLDKLKLSSGRPLDHELGQLPGPQLPSGGVCAPNISLNFCDPIKRWHLRLAAAAGVILQLGVVAFQGLARYYPTINLRDSGNILPQQAFVLSAAGALTLSIGMMLCSYAVEQCTEEIVWATQDNNSKFYLFWIQKGQMVNDQLFDSFVIAADGKRRTIMTSHLCLNSWMRVKYVDQLKGGNTETVQVPVAEPGDQYQHLSRNLKREEAKLSQFLELVTVIGSFASLSGFILQFIGLRGLHWSATVVQVGATILMTIVRTTVRRNLADKPFAYQLPSGFELEWLAMTLGSGEWSKREDGSARVSGADSQRGSPRSRLGGLFVWQRPWYKEFWAEIFSEASVGQMDWNVPCKQASAEGGLQLSDMALKSNISTTVLAVRQHLGSLTDWDGPAPEESLSLTNAMEVTMNKLHAPKASHQAERIYFPLKVERSRLAQPETVYLTFEQDINEGHKWKACEAQVEALISLWLFSLSLKGTVKGNQNNYRRPRGQVSGREERIRLLGPVTADARRDFGWWLDGNLIKLVEVQKIPLQQEPGLATSVVTQKFLGYGDAHPFDVASTHYSVHPVSPEPTGIPSEGKPTTSTQEPIYYGVYSYLSSKSSCAQHIFSIFLLNAACDIPRVSGHTVLDDKAASGNYNLQLQNSILAELAGAVALTGLCTVKEAYFGIIPALSFKNKLPGVECVVEWLRSKASLYEAIGRWDEAAQDYLWLFSTCKTFGPENDIAVRATSLLVEYTRSLRLIVALWEKQHRKGFTLDQVKELVQILSKTLDAEEQFSDLTGRLLELSSMCGELRDWGTSSEDLEQEPVTERIWPSAFGYNHLHHAALTKAGWRIKLSPGDDTMKVNAADIFGRVPLHYAAANSSDAAKYLLRLRANLRSKDIHGWTPLHYAGWYGNINAAKILVNGGAEVDAKGKDGMTPLHCTAARQHTEIAELLLGSGANAEMQDNARRTPLHWAASSGAEHIAQLLIKKGAYHKGREEYGRIPLHLASMTGCGVVEVLLELDRNVSAEAKSLATIDRDGFSPLHLAVKAGRKDVAEMLLKNGASIEAKDPSGDTALHVAARSGGEEVFELLLKGASLETRNKDGITPLDLVFWGYKKELVQLLMANAREFRSKGFLPKIVLHKAAVRGKHDRVSSLEQQETSVLIQVEPEADAGKNLKELHSAARGGNKQKVEALLENDKIRVELDGRGGSGKTALYFAAWSGNAELAKLLLRKGAEVDSNNNYGSTALHGASSQGSLEVVKVLLDHGADVSHVNHFGNDALSFAAWGGQLPVVKLLVEKGANKNSTTLWGAGMLHYSATSGNVDLLRYCLELGLDVNCVSKFGNTALHMAAMCGRVDATRFLLSVGAKHNIAGNYGTTALHFAAMGGSVEVIQLLLDQGSEIEEKDDDGNTALHFASIHGRLDVAIHLLSKNSQIDLADEFGNTALHLAILLRHTKGNAKPNRGGLGTRSLLKHLKVAAMLLDKGADVHHVDVFGNTTRDLALRTKSQEMIDLVDKHIATKSLRPGGEFT